jgi:hypothetical protein
MIVVMQGLVILFSGALAYVNRPLLEKLWRLYHTHRQAKPAKLMAPLSPAAAPDAPVALAEETVTRAVARAPEPPAAKPAPQPAPVTEVLEVVEAEIVTMGPNAPDTTDKLPWLKKSTREAGTDDNAGTDGPSDDAPTPSPAAPRKKRGPKKSKRKAGEV